jgi:NTE family protein
MKRALGVAIVAAGFLVVATSGWAQEAKRPKIGLVLGGGGARGAAHVGILKVLEENRVPVDFVVGTSMGSIVGGLYASGRSPAEIEQVFHEINWLDLFADWPTQDWLSFRRKRDLERFIDLEFGADFKKGFRLPRGFIAGQKLGFELRKHTYAVAGVSDFNRLALPYRAVSADINTGEVVVHDKGNVAEAIRASMSLPGVFPPVELDGRILIDGGIVNNVPVDVARRMGADVVIAIDVGTPLGTVAADASVLGFFNQFIGVVTEDNVRKSKAMLTGQDLLIRPELGDITSGSFERVFDAMAIGESTARAMTEQIRRYSVSEEDYQAFRKRHRSYRPEPLTVDFVKVAGLDKVNPKLVESRLRIRQGEQLSLENLKADLTRVYAMGDFEVVDFRVAEEQGKRGIVVSAKEKPWGPNYMRLGLNLQTDFSAGSSYSILAEHRKTNMNRYGAEWRNVLELGSTRGLTSDWYQPLDYVDRYFVQPGVSVTDSRRDVYLDRDLVGVYSTFSWYAGLRAGRNFGTSSQLRLELKLGKLDAEPDSQDEGVDLPVYNDVDRGTLAAVYEIDTFDNHNVPHRGTRLIASWYSSLEALGADDQYDRVSLAYTTARTFRERHTLVATLRGGLTLDEDAPYYDQFTLGGLFKMSGLADHQLVGQNTAFGGLLYYARLGKSVYVGCGLETGNTWNDRSEARFSDLLWGGDVFVAVDTVVGPIYLAYAYTEGEDNGRLRFSLGKNF